MFTLQEIHRKNWRGFLCPFLWRGGTISKEQYDALHREITETEQKHKNLYYIFLLRISPFSMRSSNCLFVSEVFRRASIWTSTGSASQ